MTWTFVIDFKNCELWWSLGLHKRSKVEIALSVTWTKILAPEWQYSSCGLAMLIHLYWSQKYVLSINFYLCFRLAPDLDVCFCFDLALPNFSESSIINYFDSNFNFNRFISICSKYPIRFNLSMESENSRIIIMIITMKSKQFKLKQSHSLMKSSTWQRAGNKFVAFPFGNEYWSHFLSISVI
jgi:hypothetical protein